MFHAQFSTQIIYTNQPSSCLLALQEVPSGSTFLGHMTSWRPTPLDSRTLGHRDRPWGREQAWHWRRRWSRSNLMTEKMVFKNC
ncbi:hypothetical protein DPMN_185091 [Dreissena polymorpha]|uniref:Uncharacterized protein n=1 Tax=Dreissena polymorpha TaxID=45954 RepID=A0A9D4I707_DREPO|nr:hypothetical protein DPMN_185091 [Dreissena polymorpha]